MLPRFHHGRDLLTLLPLSPSPFYIFQFTARLPSKTSGMHEIAADMLVEWSFYYALLD